MMKKTLVLTILCVVLCIGAYAQTADGWQTFSPPNENLTVSTPCLPKAGPGSADPSVKITEFECVHDKVLFFLQTTKFKWVGERATKDEMDKIAKSFVEGTKGQLISQSDISVGDVSGRELILKMPASGTELRAKTRLYFLADTIYTASVVMDGSAASFPPNAGRFLDSVAFKK
jgi:hypothetical protein